MSSLSDTNTRAGLRDGEGVTTRLGPAGVFFEACLVSKEGVHYICIGG